MSKAIISANQLAEFSEATDHSKKRIIKQQKIPNKFLIPWYQSAKGAIKRFFSDIKDYSPIDDAIRDLEKKVPLNERQKTDKMVSIQALDLIKQIKFPKVLSTLSYEIITTSVKEISINDVDVKVAPEIIIKASTESGVIYGGVKIHISKGKPFSHTQATYVATLVHQHLQKKVALKKDKVLPELCFCLDVFAERLVPAPSSSIKELAVIRKICDEIKTLWRA